MLVKKIVRIERAGKGVAIGESGAVIGWKRIDERASLVFNLEVKNKSFLSAEGRVRNFNESDFKSRWME